jgi:hypothetical protein
MALLTRESDMYYILMNIFVGVMLFAPLLL